MVKKLLEVFMKKNCKRLIKKKLEQKKYLKEKVINYMPNGKGIIVHLIIGLLKNILYLFKNTSCKQRIKMSRYFPKSFNPHFVQRLELIQAIMQQKQILKIFHTLILQVLH